MAGIEPMTSARCVRHDLALGPQGTCVLCRSESMRTRVQAVPLRSRVARIAAGIALFAVLLGGWRLWRGAARDNALAATPSRNPVGVAGTLLAKNSIGRSGAYYLPSRYASARVPLMVAIHGTGGSGMSMVARLRGVAERE